MLFKRAKLVAQTKDITKKVRITYYRTRMGCYSPSPYRLKYRKLSVFFLINDNGSN